jgi:hypothetical protein
VHTSVTQDLGGLSGSAMAWVAAGCYSPPRPPHFCRSDSMNKQRLIPLIVATALFMENKGRSSNVLNAHRN